MRGRTTPGGKGPTGSRTPGDDPRQTGLRLTDPPPVPPAEPEVYVSFAWKQDRAEPLVDELVAALAERGIRVLKDSNALQPGDRI